MAEAKPKDKLLTEAEVVEHHPDEWVTVEVVTTDRYGYWKKRPCNCPWPNAGKIR